MKRAVVLSFVVLLAIACPALTWSQTMGAGPSSPSQYGYSGWGSYQAPAAGGWSYWPQWRPWDQVWFGIDTVTRATPKKQIRQMLERK
jgi:hypothetical protein